MLATGETVFHEILTEPAGRPRPLNPGARVPTFRPMALGRGLRLLVLALAVVLGRAGGADHPIAVAQAGTYPIISAPRESLPAPVHDEATCAFCQAAIFPPCAPVPPACGSACAGLEYAAQFPRPTRAAPHATTHRTTSSRAPPTLRIG